MFFNNDKCYEIEGNRISVLLLKHGVFRHLHRRSELVLKSRQIDALVDKTERDAQKK